MTKNIFITGDRSMDPIAAVGFVHALLKDIIEREGAENIAIGTGNAAFGIERAVRYLIPEGSMNVVAYSTKEDGKPDFETALRGIAEQTDEVFFLHMDPLASSIGRAVTTTFAADKVRMPFQEVGLAL